MAENNENHPKPNEQTIQATIQQLWLTYYNDTLYAKGLITEDQRNRMRIKIKNRATSMERELETKRAAIRRRVAAFSSQFWVVIFRNVCYHN